MLQRRSVEYDFLGGLDEKTDDKVTLKPLYSINIRQTKTGRISQRFGTNCIGFYNAYHTGDDTSPTICSPELLTVRNDELVRVGREQLSSYALFPSLSTDQKWRDFKPESLIYRTPVSSSSAYAFDVGIAYYNGYACVVWAEYQASAGAYLIGIRASVYKTDTMTPVWTGYEVAAASATVGIPHVCSTGTGSFVVTWYDNSTIKAVVLNSTNLTWGATSTIIAATATNTNHHTHGHPTLGRFFIAYEGTGGTAGVRIQCFDTSLSSAVANTSVSADTGVYSISVCASTSGPVYVAWAVTSGGTYYGKVRGHVQSSLAASFVAQTITSSATQIVKTIGAGSSGTDCAVVLTIQDAAGSRPSGSNYGAFWATCTSTGTVTTYGVNVAQGYFESAPFYDSGTGRYYAMLTLVGALPEYTYDLSSLFLLDFDTTVGVVYPDARLVGTCAVGSFQFGARIDGPPLVVSLGSGRYMSAQTIVGQDGRYSPEIVDIRLANTKPMARQLDGKLILSGGTPSIYDGDSVAEFGFACPPDASYCSAASFNGSGSLASGAVYRILTTYEWYLADGSVMRSVVSNQQYPASNIINGGAGHDTLSYQIPYISLTNKQYSVDGTPVKSRQVNIVPYRTTANGATFYRSSDAVPSANNINNTNPAFNAFRANIIDATTDAQLRTRQVLYTTGGVLPDETPPSAACVEVIGRRVWLGGTDDDTIWYSDKVVPGEAPRFSSSRTIDPFAGGRVTAISYLSDQDVLIFKNDSVWVIRGDGPNTSGTEGDFSEPERVSADVGCVEQRSVLSTTEGVYFQSRAGICRIGKNYQVEYIGKAVEDTLGSSLISSAVLVPDLNEVRFTIAGSVNVLVYDQYHDAWRLNTYLEAGFIVSSCYWNGKWTFIDSSGFVWQETYTSWYDQNDVTVAYVNCTLWTGPIKLDGLQGWQRTWDMYLLGDKQTSHGLEIQVYTDYSQTTPAQTATWTQAQVDAWTSYEPRVHLKAQKAQALSFYIRTTPPSSNLGTGEGFRLQGIRLDVGVYDRSKRSVPSGRTR